MTATLQFVVLCAALQIFAAVLAAHRARCTIAEVRAFVAGALFRTALTWYYWRFTFGRSADARQYFSYADRASFSLRGFFRPGTSFMCNLTSLFRPLTDLFADSYLMAYVPYSFLGFCGSLLFYFSLRQVYHGLRRREPLLLAFFLPNLVFWTSNLGKDSVAFFALCAIAFGLLARPGLPGRIAAIGLGSVALYLVRPHTLLFVLAGFGFGLFLERGLFTARKAALLAVAIAAFIALFEPVSRYVGLRVEVEDDSSIAQTVESYYEATMSRIQQGADDLATGGAAIKRTSVNPAFAPLYFLQFLLGPFIWQVRKPIQFFSALENIIYQLMVLYLVIKWRAFGRMRLPAYKWSWLLYIVIAGAIMGMTYTNFGLTVRQKCMVLPAVILLYAGVRACEQSEAQRFAVARRSQGRAV